MTATRYSDHGAAATKALQDGGGWLIDHGDCVWHTTDEADAIDLTLCLVDGDRAEAARVVRHPWHSESGDEGVGVIDGPTLQGPLAITLRAVLEASR